MTQKQFETQVKKENQTDYIFNYIISFGVTISSLFFFYKLNFTDWYEIKQLSENNINFAPKNLIYILSIFLFFLGLIGILKIEKIYKATILDCLKDKSANEILIENCAEKFKMILIKKETEFYKYKYSGKLNNPFEIFFSLDERGNILVNVQQSDYNAGIFDFGTSKKVKTNIIKEIKSACR